MEKLFSRKLIVTLVYPLLVAVVKALKLDVSDELLMATAGVAASYLLGQSYVDAKEKANA